MSKPSRLIADLLLLFTAAIWGLAFVAQKQGLQTIGPFTFVGLRFALSALVVLPLAWHERSAKTPNPPMTGRDRLGIIGLVAAFFIAVALQQVGMKTASVTNAGFLTALYVVFVPIVGLIVFRHAQSIIVWPACLIALAGVWLLNGGTFSHLAVGDWLMIGCAAATAVQINLMGILVRRTQRPFTLCLWQNIVSAVGGCAIALCVEPISLPGIAAGLWPLLYAGLVSGGIGFAVQAYAQGHTPASDAAIIMSCEALFAAVGGVLLLNEHLNWVSWSGCGLIFAALLLVELYPILRKASVTDISVT